jgi:hypothetical protein
MIRYYHRHGATRTAETRRTASRLTRHGWRRCTPAQHRTAWRARDLAWTPLPREKAVADVASAGVPGSVRLVPVKH